MKTPTLYGGLVCLLPKDYETCVQKLWQELGDECGIEGIDAAPLPHFSWLLAEGFEWNALKKRLANLTRNLRPITVTTNGIGIFSGTSPIIFIPLVRTDALNVLHKRIWEAVQPIGIELSPYYAPQRWVPHITLAYEGVTPRKLNCAMQKLAFQNSDGEFKVDNISFIYDGDEETGEINYRFNFLAEDSTAKTTSPQRAQSSQRKT